MEARVHDGFWPDRIVLERVAKIDRFAPSVSSLQKNLGRLADASEAAAPK
jgi:hypothetical protein